MGLGRKECTKTEASGARTVRSLLKATSKFLLCCKVDKTFVKKKNVYVFKGNNKFNGLKISKLIRKFSSCNLSWGEYYIILRFKSSADSEISPVCRCQREICPEKASTSSPFSLEAFKFLSIW